jgi:hypothetical protein
MENILYIHDMMKHVISLNGNKSTFTISEKVDGKSHLIVLQGQNRENFDDYNPCMQMFDLFHVYNWIQFFISMYNDTTSKKIYFINELDEMGEYILLTEPKYN